MPSNGLKVNAKDFKSREHSILTVSSLQSFDNLLLLLRNSNVVLEASARYFVLELLKIIYRMCNVISDQKHQMFIRRERNDVLESPKCQSVSGGFSKSQTGSKPGER